MGVVFLRPGTPSSCTILIDMATDHEQSELADLPDQRLVSRFVARHDEEAFREIVRRHGSLVLGVCRRVLGEVHEAEDAFQATFLVLARDARKIRRRKSLACWLHGVAYRIARRVARRKYRHMDLLTAERPSSGPPVLEHIAQRSNQQLVDEELQKLPEKDLESLTLRYLEGCSNSEIADVLQISVSAVEGRLKRAKDRLRKQLLRRGITLSVFLGFLGETQLHAHVAQELVAQTVQLGLASAAGQLAADCAVQKLAISEMGEVAMSAKQISTLAAAATLLTVGMGFYGVSPYVSAQDAGKNVVVTSSQSGPAAEQPVRLASPDPFSADDGTNQLDIRTAAVAANLGASSRMRRAAEISKKLNEDMLMEFNEAPLREVLDYFQTALAFPITVDNSALEEIGMSSDTPITCSYNGISLRSALPLLLEPLDLDYVIRHEVLMITSKEAARKQLDPRVYRLESFDPQELVELITSMVAADTWEEAGGTGSIKPLGEQHLVIAQTDQIHDQIADFLEKLRLATQ